jgi:CHASE2 domain-containing sensor protein
MADETNSVAKGDAAPALPPARPAFRKRVGQRVDRVRRYDEEQIRALAATTPFLWVWGILLAIAAFQIYFDPLGFSRLTQRYSQDLVNLTVTGPLYPDRGRDQVSVALIDDKTLNDMKFTWPISYEQHARALDSILAYKPRAVVLDFLFVDLRDDPTLAQLLNVIGHYKRAGVPIYFGASSNLPDGVLPIRPEIAAAGVKLVDVNTLVDAGVARQYPTKGACFDGRPGNNCPSLAVRVYDDLYQGGVDRATPPNSHIELVWGVDTHPINRKWMTITDDAGNKLRCPQDSGIATRIYRALVDVSRLQQRCPHSGIIPAEALIRGDNDSDLPKLIENKTVLYGTWLEGTRDRAYTPAHGLVPGVYVHAMALDNLVSFYGHPKRDAVTWFGFTFHKDEIELITIALILLVITAIHLKRIRALAALPEKEQHEAAALHRWGWYALLLVLVVGSGSFLYSVYGLSIGNWVELVFIAGLLFEFLLTPYLARQWGRLRYVLGL